MNFDRATQSLHWEGRPQGTHDGPHARPLRCFGASGETIAREAMPAPTFRAWMDRHALTPDRAAEAPGLSRRTVAYCLSGEQPVPKTAMLATEG